MKRSRLAGLAVCIAALAGTAAAVPGSAAAEESAAGPGSPTSWAYRPLHPDYPQVKAQADAIAVQRAQGSTKSSHGGGGSGGGGGTGPATVNPNLGWAGVYQTSVTPPDPTGAAGPGVYIELVNDQYGAYSTTGHSLASGPLADLFADTGVSNSVLSDPQILWDPNTNHFYYVAIDTTSGAYTLLVGFSKTADPTQGFCSYRALSFGNTLPDYPKLGDMDGFLLIGVNDFANSSYVGSEVDYVAKVGTMSTGADCPPTPASGRALESDNNVSLPKATPVPAVQVGTTNTTGSVVQAADVSGSATTPAQTMYLSTVTVNSAGVPQLGSPAPVTVAPYYLPPSAPQAGTSKRLDTLDGRLEHAVQLGSTVYTAHAVSESAGGASVERWYAIDTDGTLARSGTLSDPSLYVFNGAISPTLSGSTLVLGVSTSGTNAYPAMQWVSWPSGGSNPALTAATSSNAGSVIEQSPTFDSDFSCNGRSSVCRWGDYSGASPSYDSTSGVFLSNEFSNGSGSMFSAGWRTQNDLIPAS